MGARAVERDALSNIRRRRGVGERSDRRLIRRSERLENEPSESVDVGTSHGDDLAQELRAKRRPGERRLEREQKRRGTRCVRRRSRRSGERGVRSRSGTDAVRADKIGFGSPVRRRSLRAVRLLRARRVVGVVDGADRNDFGDVGRRENRARRHGGREALVEVVESERLGARATESDGIRSALRCRRLDGLRRLFRPGLVLGRRRK